MNVNRQDIKKAKVYPQLTEYKARKKWRAQGDDLRTFLTDFVASLPESDFSGALSL